MPVIPVLYSIGAVLAVIAALLWMIKGGRLGHLFLALGMGSAAWLLWWLRQAGSDGLQDAELRELSRWSVLIAGTGLAASQTFGRSDALSRLRRHGWTWLTFAGLSAIVFVTSRWPGFTVNWTPSQGQPVLLLGNYAVLALVGHLLALVSMATAFETTFRAASVEDRSALLPTFGALAVLLGYLGFSLSISLLFNTYYGPLWALAPLTVGGGAVTLIVAAFRRRSGDVQVGSGSEPGSRPVSPFLAGMYALSLGVVGEAVRWTGLRVSTVGLILIALLCAAGLLLLLMSNRLKSKTRAFVDRNFFLSHHDYQRQWPQVCRRFRPQLGLGAVLSTTSDLLHDIFGVREVSVFLKRPNEDQLDLVYSGMSGEAITLAMSEPLPRHLDRTRQALELSRRADDFEAVPIWVENHSVLARTGARVWAPLLVGEELVGMVGLGPRLNDLRFSYEDLDFLEVLCATFALVLWGARIAEAQSAEREAQAIRRLSGFVAQDLQSLRALARLGGEGPDQPGAPVPWRGEARRQVEEALEDAAFQWGRLQEEPGRAREQCDLNAMLLELLSELEGSAIPEGVRVVRELEPGLPPVQADIARLRGGIRALLRNAVEAMPEGGELRVWTRMAGNDPAGGAPGRVIIGIRDTGAGMTREFLDRQLFRPFVTTKENAMGLGLYETRQVVEAHGGAVRVDSETGRGSSFVVELPAAESA